MNDKLTDVFISDEVQLVCHNLALLTEKEEVAALLIGQVSDSRILNFVFVYLTMYLLILLENCARQRRYCFRIGTVYTTSWGNKERPR